MKQNEAILWRGIIYSNICVCPVPFRHVTTLCPPRGEAAVRLLWVSLKLKAFNGQCEEKYNITFTFRMLLYGVKQFNLQPERGLKYLQENGFLENNPDSVAKFLFRQERLSKKQIGEWADSLSNVDIESNSWHWWHWTNFFTRCRQVSWKPLGIQQRSPTPLCPMPWIYPTFIGPSLEAVLVEFQVCNWS